MSHVLHVNHDKCAHEFPSVSYYQRLLDITAALQRVLQRCAGHILTIRENQNLLAPAGNGDAAIGVHVAQVAGL